MKIDPTINLAIDNCFASKRWTEPKEWMSIAKNLGLQYVEASADNECDPLYSTPEYLNQWINEIKDNSEKTGVKVCNLYSGHGTYATLGLSHPDGAVRKHIRDDWLKQMILNARALDAGLGFYCHAFNQSTLQDKKLYQQRYDDLMHDLSELAKFAANAGLSSIGVEQMYTPHQVPWTVTGAVNLIKEVFLNAQQPFYITLDVGHQSGQRKFLKPSRESIIEHIKNNSKPSTIWLGSDRRHKLFNNCLDRSKTDQTIICDELLNEKDSHPHLYASYQDGDPYYWLENLGAFSPIIHLQQTDGTHSAHLPFTEENNKQGIIHGDKVLESIFNSYQNTDDAGLPPACPEIFLTIEVFASTASYPYKTLDDLQSTVDYWRKFIPKDGMKLSELVKN